MNRREAIFNFLVITASIGLLEGCDSGPAQPETPLKNLKLSSDDHKMLLRLADLTIPKTDFPGAADIEATAFTLLMVDDCYSPEKQRSFEKGLRAFQEAAKDKIGKDFMRATPTEQIGFLKFAEEKGSLKDEAQSFWAAVRALTIQAFTSSKQYLTDVAKFKLVPGSNFRGCVPLKKPDISA